MTARLPRRRLLTGALLAAAPRGAWAQPAAKLPRIAYMSFGPLARNTLAGSHESHVAKILRRARPGDIPVEQPTRFSIVANLKTERALDLTLPPALLLRADRTIE